LLQISFLFHGFCFLAPTFFHISICTWRKCCYKLFLVFYMFFIFGYAFKKLFVTLCYQFKFVFLQSVFVFAFFHTVCSNCSLTWNFGGPSQVCHYDLETTSFVPSECFEMTNPFIQFNGNYRFIPLFCVRQCLPSNTSIVHRER